MSAYPSHLATVVLAPGEQALIGHCKGLGLTGATHRWSLTGTGVQQTSGQKVSNDAVHNKSAHSQTGSLERLRPNQCYPGIEYGRAHYVSHPASSDLRHSHFAPFVSLMLSSICCCIKITKYLPIARWISFWVTFACGSPRRGCYCTQG